MLIFGRHRGEDIRIGDDITIRVIAVKGDRVEIAVIAPRSCPIRRGEMKPRKPARPAPFRPWAKGKA